MTGTRKWKREAKARGECREFNSNRTGSVERHFEFLMILMDDHVQSIINNI